MADHIDDLENLRTSFVESCSKVVINQLLDDLLGDGVINDEEKESILENQSRANKARNLIDVVRKKGNEASRKMIVHFKQRDPMLFSELFT
uniref:CARD domain-containing protein n=1 Tax=Fundulus heteroclitus TaxID=8078 RepID=A0A3Q2TN46_FUNHE